MFVCIVSQKRVSRLIDSKYPCHILPLITILTEVESSPSGFFAMHVYRPELIWVAFLIRRIEMSPAFSINTFGARDSSSLESEIMFPSLAQANDNDWRKPAETVQMRFTVDASG